MIKNLLNNIWPLKYLIDYVFKKVLGEYLENDFDFNNLFLDIKDGISFSVKNLKLNSERINEKHLSNSFMKLIDSEIGMINVEYNKSSKAINLKIEDVIISLATHFDLNTKVNGSFINSTKNKNLIKSTNKDLIDIDSSKEIILINNILNSCFSNFKVNITNIIVFVNQHKVDSYFLPNPLWFFGVSNVYYGCSDEKENINRKVSTNSNKSNDLNIQAENSNPDLILNIHDIEKEIDSMDKNEKEIKISIIENTFMNIDNLIIKLYNRSVDKNDIIKTFKESNSNLLREFKFIVDSSTILFLSGKAIPAISLEIGEKNEEDILSVKINIVSIESVLSSLQFKLLHLFLDVIGNFKEKSIYINNSNMNKKEQNTEKKSSEYIQINSNLNIDLQIQLNRISITLLKDKSSSNTCNKIQNNVKEVNKSNDFRLYSKYKGFIFDLNQDELLINSNYKDCKEEIVSQYDYLQEDKITFGLLNLEIINKSLKIENIFCSIGYFVSANDKKLTENNLNTSNINLKLSKIVILSEMQKSLMKKSFILEKGEQGMNKLKCSRVLNESFIQNKIICENKLLNTSFTSVRDNSFATNNSIYESAVDNNQIIENNNDLKLETSLNGNTTINNISFESMIDIRYKEIEEMDKVLNSYDYKNENYDILYIKSLNIKLENKINQSRLNESKEINFSENNIDIEIITKFIKIDLSLFFILEFMEYFFNDSLKSFVEKYNFNPDYFSGNNNSIKKMYLDKFVTCFINLNKLNDIFSRTRINFKLIDLELNLFSYKNREKTNDYLESFLFKNILKKSSEKVKVTDFIDKERGLRLKINDFNYNHINKNSIMFSRKDEKSLEIFSDSINEINTVFNSIDLFLFKNYKSINNLDNCSNVDEFKFLSILGDGYENPIIVLDEKNYKIEELTYENESETNQKTDIIKVKKSCSQITNNTKIMINISEIKCQLLYFNNIERKEFHLNRIIKNIMFQNDMLNIIKLYNHYLINLSNSYNEEYLNCFKFPSIYVTYLDNNEYIKEEYLDIDCNLAKLTINIKKIVDKNTNVNTITSCTNNQDVTKVFIDTYNNNDDVDIFNINKYDYIQMFKINIHELNLHNLIKDGIIKELKIKANYLSISTNSLFSNKLDNDNEITLLQCFLSNKIKVNNQNNNFIGQSNYYMNDFKFYVIEIDLGIESFKKLKKSNYSFSIKETILNEPNITFTDFVYLNKIYLPDMKIDLKINVNNLVIFPISQNLNFGNLNKTINEIKESLESSDSNENEICQNIDLNVFISNEVSLFVNVTISELIILVCHAYYYFIISIEQIKFGITKFVTNQEKFDQKINKQEISLEMNYVLVNFLSLEKCYKTYNLMKIEVLKQVFYLSPSQFIFLFNDYGLENCYFKKLGFIEIAFINKLIFNFEKVNIIRDELEKNEKIDKKNSDFEIIDHFMNQIDITNHIKINFSIGNLDISFCNDSLVELSNFTSTLKYYLDTCKDNKIIVNKELEQSNILEFKDKKTSQIDTNDETELINYAKSFKFLISEVKINFYDGKDFDFIKDYEKYIFEDVKYEQKSKESKLNLKISNNENFFKMSFSKMKESMNELSTSKKINIIDDHFSNNSSNLKSQNISSVKKSIAEFTYKEPIKKIRNSFKDNVNYITFYLKNCSLELVLQINEDVYCKFIIKNLEIQDNVQNSKYKMLFSKLINFSDHVKDDLICIETDIMKNKHSNCFEMKLMIYLKNINVLVGQQTLNLIFDYYTYLEENRINEETLKALFKWDLMLNSNVIEKSSIKFLRKTYIDPLSSMVVIENSKKSTKKEDDKKNDILSITSFHINKFNIKISYNSSSFKISKVTKQYIELLNLANISGLEIVFKEVKMNSKLSVDQLLKFILSEYVDDIKSNQITSIISSFSFLQPITKLLDGAFDIVRQPYYHFLNNQYVTYGLSVGIKNFVVGLTTQSVFLGEKVRNFI